MKYSSLIPGIDRRLDTWIQVHETLNKRTQVANKLTITLSREYGCEAYPLAEQLSGELAEITGEPWNIFDHAVIEEIASKERISEEFLSNLDDSAEILDTIMANFVNDLSHDGACQKIVNYIIKVALLGNAIIVGRGSSIITQNFNNCFHFRLEAPVDYRIRSIMMRMNITKEEAMRNIEENEKVRNQFITKYFSQKIDDKNLYNAVFNNEKCSIYQISNSIQGLMTDVL